MCARRGGRSFAWLSTEQAVCDGNYRFKDGKPVHLLERKERRFRRVVRRYRLAFDMAAEEDLQIVVDLVALDAQEHEWRKLPHCEPRLLGQFAPRRVLQRLAGLDAPAWERIVAARRCLTAQHKQQAVLALQGDRDGWQDLSCAHHIPMAKFGGYPPAILAGAGVSPQLVPDESPCIKENGHQREMCGRYSLTAGPDEVEEFFALAGVEDFPARYNIAPTQPILLVIAGERREPGSNLPSRRTMLARWGLIPAWAKNPADMPLNINARSETAAEKASFKTAMRHRRVLVPASGFYEWRRSGKNRSQAFWVRPKRGGVVAFGGLMETYAEAGGSEIDTAALLTTAASGDIVHIHDRMPVVIQPRDFEQWLDCRGQEPRDVAHLMRPTEGFFEAIPVSDKVNKVANTGPELQEREEASSNVEPPEQKTAPAQLTLF